MIDYSYLTPPNSYKLLKFSSIDKKMKKLIYLKQQMTNQQEESSIIIITNNSNAIKQNKQKNTSVKKHQISIIQINCDFMMNQITTKISIYDQWHQNQHITTITKTGRQILEYGHIYTYGRDDYYCPIIIIRPNKIDLKKYRIEDYQNAIYALLEPIERYMLVGGYIQKWNLLIDFQNKKCSLNMVQVTNTLKKLLYAYPYRLKRLLFINTKSINELYINQITMIIDDKNKQVHIQIMNNNSMLNNIIKEQERQKKYGGILTNLCEYWPINTTSKHEQRQDDSMTMTQYKSVMNDVQFFGQNQHQMCSCMDSKCNIY